MTSEDTGNIAAAFQASADSRPEVVATVMGGVETTYGELAEKVANAAGRLQAAGIEPGDRIAIVSENRPEYIAAFLAVARIRGVLVTVYPSFGSDEYAYILEDSAPKVVLVERSMRERLGAGISPHMDIVVLDLIESVSAFDAPLRDSLAVEPGEGVLICYTSGTTSRPKAVFHSHSGLLGATGIHIDVWHFSEVDVMLVAAPMAWLFGIVNTSLSAVLVGAKLVMFEHFNPVKALTLMREQQVTTILAVGTMFVKLAQVAAEQGVSAQDFALRFCLAGGEARREVAFAQFRDLFDCEIHDVYAASECFPLVSYDPDTDRVPKPSSAGRVVPGASVRIIDFAGHDVPHGQVGELIGKSAASMIGYYNKPELTAEVVDTDGWYHSKDLAYIDEDGYVFIVGRYSDMVIRGGANISPAEVERALISHPDVLEAAVVGEPDETYGQRVAAHVVVSSDSLTAADLETHVASLVAKYKVPERIVIRDDLPRTANGKVKKSALVAEEVTDGGQA